MDELAEEKDAEAGEEVRHDEALVGVHPPPADDHHEERDHGDEEGDHHGPQNHEKDHLAAGELELAQNISGHCAHQHLSGYNRARGEQAVEVHAPNREALKEDEKIAEKQILGNECRRDCFQVPDWPERAQKRENQGADHQGSTQRQHSVADEHRKN